MADTRLHGTTRRQVSGAFELEKPHLQPLPPSLFACYRESLRRVARDSSVQVDRAYYQVPLEHIGRDVWVQIESRSVRIFNQRRELIASHLPLAPGRFSSVQGVGGFDSKGIGARQAAHQWLQLAGKYGPHAKAWAEAVWSARSIEGVRSLMGLAGLGRNHSSHAIEQACASAHNLSAHRLSDIQRLLKQGTAATPIQELLPWTSLKTQARQLRLSGLCESLELRLHEATTHQLPPAQFLELLFQDELNIRHSRTLHRRSQQASFREQRSLDTFDFSFQPSLSRSQIYHLATSQYLREHRDILFIGPPGTGKSHLAQALGREAIKAGYTSLYRSVFDLARDLADTSHQPAERDKALQRYLRTDLLILDDMGMRTLSQQATEHLLEIIMRRYELRSTILTSNRPVDQWGQLLGDQPTATAILDRILHRAEIIHITGRSYRLQQAVQQRTGPTPAPSATTAEPTSSAPVLPVPPTVAPIVPPSTKTPKPAKPPSTIGPKKSDQANPAK